jgi:hypothetical protein
VRRASDPAQPQVRAAPGARAGRSRPEADLLRRVVYTTNAIEALNRQLRKAIKTKGHLAAENIRGCAAT